MLRFAAFALLVPALCAQLNTDVLEKAPPDVEDALRARITQFYQFHVEGKFRQAEQLVAEDSKDFFYNAGKPTYFKFSINKIQYSDNFTKALATVLCNMIIPVPGFMNKPFDVPTPSRWKLENGQWCWYIDKDQLLQTPFGKRNAPPDGAPPAPGAAAPMPAQLPTPEDLPNLLNHVQADKKVVRLNPEKASSDQVVIENRLPGAVKLALNAPKVEGLEARFDQPELKSGEKTILKFSYKPGKTPPGRIAATVTVEPTNQAIPVDVVFAK